MQIKNLIKKYKMVYYFLMRLPGGAAGNRIYLQDALPY